jgi:hypothetical protein
LRFQQSGQQKTSRPGTNNANLGTHVSRLQIAVADQQR